MVRGQGKERRWKEDWWNYGGGTTNEKIELPHLLNLLSSKGNNKYSSIRNSEVEPIVGVHVQLEKNLQLVAKDLPFWKAFQG